MSKADKGERVQNREKMTRMQHKNRNSTPETVWQCLARGTDLHLAQARGRDEVAGRHEIFHFVSDDLSKKETGYENAGEIAKSGIVEREEERERDR